MIKESKGITLIALTITIIILLILASITTYSGISTIKSSKLNKFKQELEIMQSEVQLLYEKYKEANTIDIGKEISGSGKEEQAEEAFIGATETETSGYRLFEPEDIQKLGIEGIQRAYLLDIMNRKVISLEPFEQNGVAYYTLEQITDKNTINEGVIRDNVNFSVSTKKISSGWEITVSNIEYSKYVGKGKILYQKVGSENWTTVVDDFKGNEYTFSVSSEGEYNIKIIDAAGKEKTTENPITIGALGNYLLDGTTYYDTLQEAVDAASNTSTIKVMRDITEVSSININKDVTINLNEKSITMANETHIEIEADYNVMIEGAGNIIGESNTNFSVILNKGNLEINNVNISSSINGPLIGTIGNYGTLTLNSCQISNNIEDGNSIITWNQNNNTIINNGTYGRIYNYDCNLIINGGTIQNIFINGTHSISTINEGTVNKLESNLGADAVGTFIIGNINSDMNTSNPVINNIDVSVTSFYSGILRSESSSCFNSIQVREGYTTQVTYNSSTGLYECILVSE